MAGVAGFEPTNDGVRVRCLTAWRHPNIVCAAHRRNCEIYYNVQIQKLQAFLLCFAHFYFLFAPTHKQTSRKIPHAVGRVRAESGLGSA